MKEKDVTFVAMVIVMFCLVLMVGCNEVPQTDKLYVTPKVAPSTNQVETVERFVVTSQGTFNAGYNDSKREIFILKDVKTGKEYLGITDCTLIKIHEAKEEAAEEAADVALDLLDVAIDIAAE